MPVQNPLADSASAFDPSARWRAAVDRFAAARSVALEANVSSPREGIGHHLYIADGRTPLFHLQALCRVARATGPRRGLWESWLPRFKEVEDLLGGYDYWLELHRRMADWQIFPPALLFAHQRLQRAQGALEYVLQRGGWLRLDDEGDPLAAFRRDLQTVRWRGPMRQARDLAGFLRNEARQLDKRWRSGGLDLNQVEDGIHALRRKLRWLAIYALSSGGAVALDKPARKGPLGHYATREALSGRYVPPAATDPQPVTLHAGAYLAIGALVAALGTWKDRALWSEETLRCIEIAGGGAAERKAAVRAMGDTYITHAEVAAVVRREVDRMLGDEKVLQVWADHLDAQAG